MIETCETVVVPPDWVDWPDWPDDPLEVWERPVEVLSVDDLLSQLAYAEQQRAMVDGRRLRLLARYREVRAREGKFAARSAPEEVAVALRCAPGRAEGELHAATDLITRLPDTAVALETGEIDLPRARAIADTTRVLDVGQARQVEAKVLPKAAGDYVLQQVKNSARYYVQKVDPERAEQRRQRRLVQRRVSYEPLDDGGGELAVLGCGERTYAAWMLIDTLARQLRAAGDDRTLDQSRHDVMMDLILGTDAQRVLVHLYLHVPATTLAGITDDPGILAGYGPVTAQACRELAATDATWRRVFTDPITGTVKDVDRHSYRPSAALQEYVEVRDGTCRFPGCVRPAPLCEIDHSEAWATGGTTSDGNLGPNCKRHHRLKHLCGWKLEQPEPGRFIWTSPVGQCREVQPEPILDLTTEDIPPF